MLPWDRRGRGDSTLRRFTAATASSAISVVFAQSNGSFSVREITTFRAALIGAWLGSVSGGATRWNKR